jgi:phenylacetate-CoA ligase
VNKYLSRYLCYYPATLLKGEKINSALRQSRQFQWLSRSTIADYQWKKAQGIACWAKENSAFYRKLYQDVDIGAIADMDDFARLPTIDKTDLMERETDIVTNFGGQCEIKTTGGSTGHPVKVVKNAGALAMERAVTWRSYEWAGVSIGDPQGRFWGVPHTRKGKFKALIADLIVNRRRVSAFNLNNASLANYYTELKVFKPSYLYGYASVIEALANFISDKRLPPITSVNSIITTSEILYPQSREMIETAFGVKVYNEYGCGEVGSIAHECEHGNMHIMADSLLVEVSGADEGEILITDFHNYKTPLIRYRVGDYGKLVDIDCPCGRGLPVLATIYGRAYDLIRLKSGTSIHPESLIYVIEDFQAEVDAITQFQAIQQTYDTVDIYVIPKSSWTEVIAERLKQRLKTCLSGELNYRIQTVQCLQRERSGKMRLVKSYI